MRFSPFELWSSMGPFAQVIVAAMLLMSLISVLVTCERAVVFFRSRKASRRYAERMAKLFAPSTPTLRFDASSLESARGSEDLGHLGRVIDAGLSAFKTSPMEDKEFTVETVARALERQSQRELQELKRGHGVLATISSTAPFVGLLGTVMGIVTAFEQMAASGQGGLATVSAGVAEALVTTAMGLFVAIPAVVAFNFLQGWVDARAVDLAESSNEFIDFIARQLRQRLPAAAE
jgi:biopolymer transport protein ExbB/biopolymer transport protein TolQ